MDLLFSTLNEYKKAYVSRLSAYLNDYEDNTECSFLSLELEKYALYYKTLVTGDNVEINNVESANRIIEFISKQLDISRSPNKIATSLYLTGELPPSLRLKRTTVPKQEIVINSETDITPKKAENPHPHVFLNTDGYKLFQKLYEGFKDSQNQLADFSFIYRKMYDEGYIRNSFRPQMFINWINKEPYQISLPKIKTLEDCTTDNKIQIYNNAKELLNIK